MRAALLRFALIYAAHGWPVFPCRPRHKEPITERGYLDATADEQAVRSLWRGSPNANIGFAPGRAGYLIIDIDCAEGQAAAIRLGLFAEPTLHVLTPRGRHLYFRHPGDTIGNRKLCGVLDVRADRGYVLLPPSIHPTGFRYRAVGKLTEIAELPPAALDVLRRTDEPRLAPGVSMPSIDAGTPRRRAYVVSAIERECIELANTGEGNRNNRLNEAAFSLARFVATGEADPAKLVDVLVTAARHAGLDDEEIERTIRSAFGARGVTA